MIVRSELYIPGLLDQCYTQLLGAMSLRFYGRDLSCSPEVNINKTAAVNLFLNADVSAITHSRHNMTPSADPYLLLSQLAAHYEQ